MQIGDLTVNEFLAALGAKTPTPGGGAVAAVLTALGAALGRMVINYAEGKPKFAEYEDLHRASRETLKSLGVRSLVLAAEDARAYAHLSELMKLDKDDVRRKAEWPDAVDGAIAAPCGALNLAESTLIAIAPLVGKTSSMLASDLAIAAIAAECAARAAAWNIRINLPLLEDASAAREVNEHTTVVVDRARALSDQIAAACAAD